MMTFELKHRILLDKDSVRIWYENVGSGSNIMADVYLRILGLFWEYGYMDSSLINSSGGGSCIAGSIPILLSNGTYELARYIKIGDEVSTYNINNHNIENGIITGIKSTYESSCYIINGNLIIAPNQTILTLNGYISAEDLTLNDSLYNIYTNSFINIYSILKINQSEIMFDFMISINSNFIGIYYVLGDTIIC